MSTKRIILGAILLTLSGCHDAEMPAPEFRDNSTRPLWTVNWGTSTLRITAVTNQVRANTWWMHPNCQVTMTPGEADVVAETIEDMYGVVGFQEIVLASMDVVWVETAPHEPTGEIRTYLYTGYQQPFTSCRMNLGGLQVAWFVVADDLHEAATVATNLFAG